MRGRCNSVGTTGTESLTGGWGSWRTHVVAGAQAATECVAACVADPFQLLQSFLVRQAVFQHARPRGVPCPGKSKPPLGWENHKLAGVGCREIEGEGGCAEG